MDISWEDLKIFAATYAAGSFSAAAKELKLGQATISRRIAALEEQLGHLLFDRAQSGLRPTGAAKLLLPYSESMMTSALQASAALQGLEVAAEGKVRLAVPPGIAVDLLPRLLPKLYKNYPQIRIEVLSDNFVRRIDQREADIAFRTIRPESGELLVRTVGTAKLGLFASPKYLDTIPKPLKLENLDFLSWSDDLAHIPMAKWIEENSPKPPIFTSNSFLALQQVAIRGLGVLIMPELQAELGGLVPIPNQDFKLPDIPYYLVVHRALRHVPRVSVVMDWLLQGIEDLRNGELE